MDLNQIFAPWFVPFYKAHVHFVAVMTLVIENPDTSHRREGLQYSDVTAERRPRYLVAKQEDHYQLNDISNFLLPWLGPLLCRAGQNIATIACVVGALVCEVILRIVFGGEQANKTPMAYKPLSQAK
ncbi:hypothetical protein IMZ48_31280 [Candidatus Bathyarchaeota archaeon]|nr:hypothetical protein [Candidatus Bathyarchaeota archaeon]